MDGSFTCLSVEGGEKHALKFFLKRIHSEKEAFLHGSFTCLTVQGGETHALKFFLKRIHSEKEAILDGSFTCLNVFEVERRMH